MTPVFQTDFTNKSGNCLQAVIASLFDLPLNEVPHFVIQEDWKQSLADFYKSQGYLYEGLGWANNNFLYFKNKEYDKINPQREIDVSEIQFVNNYACAQVYSPKYFRNKNLNQGFHAVIVNRNLEIVHDPVMTYNGVKYPLTRILGSNGICLIDKIEKL